MAKSLRATIQASLNWIFRSSGDDGDAIVTAEMHAPIVLAQGTGSGRADIAYQDKSRTLAASATENLDLAGVLTDVFGATITDAKVKAIEVWADPGNTNDVVFGGAASNAFVGPFGGTLPTMALQPGGRAVIVAPNAGWTVTAGTGDILKVTNGGAGTPVTYGIKVLGASA